MVFSESIPSKLEVLHELIPRLLKKFKAASMHDDDMFVLQLALEEALVNAIKHGNKMNPDLLVAVTIQLSSDEIVITIKDKGEGFDHEVVSNPTQEENINRLSGRGVFLIKNLMDTVEYFDQGSGIRMAKNLKKGDR